MFYTSGATARPPWTGHSPLHSSQAVIATNVKKALRESVPPGFSHTFG